MRRFITLTLSSLGDLQHEFPKELRLRLLSLHQSHPGGLRHINMMSFYLGKEGHKKAKNLDTKVIITLYFLLYSGIVVHTYMTVC